MQPRPESNIAGCTDGTTLGPDFSFFKIDVCSDLVVRGGIEPPTFRFSGGRSYQLSYLTSTGPRRPAPGWRPCPGDRSGPDGI